MYSAKTKSPLASAEKAAQTYSDSQAVGTTTMPCPNAKQELKEVIKVKVVGEDGVGIDGIALQLIRDDKQILTGKTAPDGVYAFKGLEPGTYQLSLPELDKDAWKELSTEALPEGEAKSSSVASWQSAAAQTIEEEKTHVIKQGEYVGRIAELYGFFPQTIWDYRSNSALKALRRDNMYILLPDDKMIIPCIRQTSMATATGCELTVQRQGVPERLRIRFLRYDESPRASVPYLLSLGTADDKPVTDIASKTDNNGFVNQPIPPSSFFARITLNPGPWAEVHEFHLGKTDPIDTVTGWQARLNNLSYNCGPIDGVLGIKTKAAIHAFQKAKHLPQTGEMDSNTELALQKLSLS